MVKQRLWAAALALVLLLTSLALSTLVDAQGNPGSTVQVESIGLAVGGSGTVAIQVKNITDPAGLGAYLFTITYNPAVIRVNGVLAGDSPFDGVPTSNVTDGKVIFSTIQVKQTPGPTGDIVVARLNVTLIAAGSTDLMLAINTDGLLDTSGSDISAVVVNGRVMVAGAAAKLAFTTQPGSSNTVGTAFGTQPVVTIQDAGGNTVTTSTAAVTLAITSGTGASGAALSGTTTVYAANGVAYFSGLSISLAGSGYTLTASSSGLASATSSYFNVGVSGAGAAINLAFTIQPSSSNTVGTAFGTQPVVTIQDSNGNTVTTSTALVTLAITTGTGTSGATLSGNATVYAYYGVATFSGLSINLLGSGYTLIASSSGLASASSSYFNVVAVAAVKLAFIIQPSISNTAGTAFGTQPVVAIQDSNGTTVTASTALVTLAITSGTGTSGAALLGMVAVNAVNGMATFSGLSINLPGTYILIASSSGMASTTSSYFNVVAVAAKLAFIIQPSISNTAGTAFGTPPVVTIQDSNGNTVNTSIATVTLTINPGTGTSGASLSGITTVNTVNGIATFSGLNINLAGSGYTLIATSSGLASAASGAFNVIGGSTTIPTPTPMLTPTILPTSIPLNLAAKLVFTTQPSSSNALGKGFGTQPVVTIQDVGGNTVTTSTAAVTLAITPGTGPSRASLLGITTVNAINGVATFSWLSINLAGSGYTLTASSSGLTSAISSAFNVVSGTIPTPTTLPTPITLDLSAKIDEKGVVQEDIEHSVLAGQVVLNIPKGTKVLTVGGEPLQSITVEEISTDIPPSPSGAHIIGFAYNLGPDGATFDPAITITMKYDPVAVPQGVAETDLVLAYYDVASSTWQTLSDIVVDTVNHTVSGKASHFTQFSILAPTPTPVETSTPAETPSSSETPTSEGGGKSTNLWVIIVPILVLAIAALVYFFVIRPRLRRKRV